MFKCEGISAGFVASGDFDNALSPFLYEMGEALRLGIITESEMFGNKGLIKKFFEASYPVTDMESCVELSRMLYILYGRIEQAKENL